MTTLFPPTRASAPVHDNSTQNNNDKNYNMLMLNKASKDSFASWEIETHSIIVIPSLSFSARELQIIDCVLSYEERVLFVLFALSNPATQLLIVTSTRLDEAVIRYHLSFLPKDQQENARYRVHFYSLDDSSTDRCLAEKLLSNPTAIDCIKNYCIEAKLTCKATLPSSLMIWRATEHEEQLSAVLDLPYYSATHDQSWFGTKPGSRSVFRLLNIPCADGTYKEERDFDALCQSIWQVLGRNPKAQKGVVKLSDGFCGIGNVVLDLKMVQERLKLLEEYHHDFKSDSELDHLTKMAFQNATYHHRTWEDYRDELAIMGGIFEIFIDIDDDDLDPEYHQRCTSPSVQGVIDEHGCVTLLSTHEQLLDHQMYLGCEFPCKPEYRLQLLDYGQRIGDFLACAGIRDRFGVDFMCVPKRHGTWEIWAVEINLRITGTTHPWMSLKLLTHGTIDSATGLFRTPAGKPKYYVSSDAVTVSNMKNQLHPADLCRLMNTRPDLHWNSEKESGVILHMLSRVCKTGTLSITAIGDSTEDAH